MAEVMTQDRAAKRDKTRMVADDIVTANSLATHLGCTRQNIAWLTAAPLNRTLTSQLAVSARTRCRRFVAKAAVVPLRWRGVVEAWGLTILLTRGHTKAPVLCRRNTWQNHNAQTNYQPEHDFHLVLLVLRPARHGKN